MPPVPSLHRCNTKTPGHPQLEGQGTSHRTGALAAQMSHKQVKILLMQEPQDSSRDQQHAQCQESCCKSSTEPDIPKSTRYPAANSITRCRKVHKMLPVHRNVSQGTNQCIQGRNCHGHRDREPSQVQIRASRAHGGQMKKAGWTDRWDQWDTRAFARQELSSTRGAPATPSTSFPVPTEEEGAARSQHSPAPPSPLLCLLMPGSRPQPAACNPNTAMCSTAKAAPAQQL